MKLISMTAFVLEREMSDKTIMKRFVEICDYANFLNQHLTLGMFVPCDEDGNVLEQPTAKNSLNTIDHDLRLMNYKEAKDKVLFEGFEYAKTHSIGMEKVLDLFVFPYTETKIGLTKKSEGFRTWFKLEKIEDLVQCNLTLTPNAIKQLKL